MLQRVAVELLPPEPISTADWAERYLYLPEESADLPGSYSLDYAPYLKGIFAALDDPNIPEVDVMKAAQVGWTQGVIAFLGKRIDREPCPIVALFAADEAAREFVDEKLTPTILATPALSRRIDVSMSRKSGNRSLFKKFQGGFLKMGGSGSIHKVKSTPAKVVLVEEPDDAKDNLKEQGDAIRLLWERTKRQRNAKRLMGGTPSVAGLSRIEEHIEQSDKRVLPVACHDCGEQHVLSFDNVTWPGKDGDIDSGDPHPVYGYAQPDESVYVCPHCGSPWDDYQRKENIRNTVAEAEAAGDPMFGWMPTAPFHGVAGFIELNELYSCLPGAGVADLVRDYLEAEHKAERGDENNKIVFVNSKLARPYEFKGDESSPDALREKAEDYPELVCPAGAYLVTAGVDVQHNRLAIVIRAWGPGQESWLMYWGELIADKKTSLEEDAVWVALDDLLFSGFKHELGGQIHLAAVSIDSGDGQTSDAVYAWVRSRRKQHRNTLVMATKGSSARTDPEIFIHPPERSIDHKNPKRKTKADKYGVKVYIIGTSKAKDWISERIGMAGSGPGYFHFYESVRDDYFEQVTAETKAPNPRLRKRTWQVKSGRRNEGVDCEVGALHAARAKRVHLMKPSQWQALEQQVRQPVLFDDNETAGAAKEKAVAGRFKVNKKTRRY